MRQVIVGQVPAGMPEAPDDDLQPQLTALEPGKPIGFAQVLVADQGQISEQIAGGCGRLGGDLVARQRPVPLIEGI